MSPLGGRMAGVSRINGDGGFLVREASKALVQTEAKSHVQVFRSGIRA